MPLVESPGRPDVTAEASVRAHPSGLPCPLRAQAPDRKYIDFQGMSTCIGGLECLLMEPLNRAVARVCPSGRRHGDNGCTLIGYESAPGREDTSRKSNVLRSKISEELPSAVAQTITDCGYLSGTRRPRAEGRSNVEG